MQLPFKNEPEVSRERISIITASGVEKVSLITLDSIIVLGKKAEGVSAVVHNLPQKSYVELAFGIELP